MALITPPSFRKASLNLTGGLTTRLDLIVRSTGLGCASDTIIGLLAVPDLLSVTGLSMTTVGWL